MRKKVILETDSTTLSSAYKNFIKTKKAIGLVPKTIESYDQSYKLFIEFLLYEEKKKALANNLPMPENITQESVAQKTRCDDITADAITDYTLYLRETRPHLVDVSLQTYLKNLRTILNFFMDKGYMSMFKVAVPTAIRKVRETYTLRELELLLQKPNLRTCRDEEFRNWVVINYLLGTGNRLSTICNIRITDVDFDAEEVVIRQVKNKRQYTLPLSPEILAVLKFYLDNTEWEESDYLFAKRNGDKLTEEGLKTAIERYNLSRGVSRTSPHAFRNTFAKRFLLNGGDVHRLKKYLGHSSIQMAERYVEMFGADLHRDKEKLNPLDTIMEDINNSKKSKVEEKRRGIKRG